MKTATYLKIAAVAFLPFAFATSGCNLTDKSSDNQLEATMNIYDAIWNDIMNKGENDRINAIYFTKNVSSIASPQKVVEIENFIACYQNYLTGFSNIKINNVFGQGNKIAKYRRIQGIHSGHFWPFDYVQFCACSSGFLCEIRVAKNIAFQQFLDMK